MLKKISILGATGTIGQNTIEVILDNPESFIVESLSAQNNWELLAETAIKLNAKNILIENPVHYNDLKQRLKSYNINILAGSSNYPQLANDESELVVSAIVGIAGLAPTIEYIKAGKNIALANKESLICAGFLLKKLAQQYNVSLIPIDSEHTAILQIYNHRHHHHIKDIIITASGGPFKDFTSEQLEHVTPAMAIKHPNWNMGRKISVDSATLANKGLELMEAYFLFDIDPKQISAILHPQSLIHAIINFTDGNSLMHSSLPNMQVAISYALAFPNRARTAVNNLDLTKVEKLHFSNIEEDLFPCFKLAKQVLSTQNQALMICFNTANEIAVKHFLDHRIKFTDISKIIESSLNHYHDLTTPQNIEECFSLVNNITNFIEESQKIYVR